MTVVQNATEHANTLGGEKNLPGSAHLAWFQCLIIAGGVFELFLGDGGRKTLVDEQLLDALAAQLVAGDQRHLLLPEVGDVSLGLLTQTKGIVRGGCCERGVKETFLVGWGWVLES